MNKGKCFASLALLLLPFAVGCEDKDDGTGPAGTTTYRATLTGAAEVPAVTTNATGNATITVDAARNLTYTVSFANLGSGTTAAHIHAPAAPGANANPVVTLAITNGVTAQTVGPTTVNLNTVLAGGTINADSLVKLLDAGRAYVNVHTANNLGGEIRGWLAKQ